MNRQSSTPTGRAGSGHGQSLCIGMHGVYTCAVQGVMLLHRFLSGLQQAPRRKEPVDTNCRYVHTCGLCGPV